MMGITGFVSSNVGTPPLSHGISLVSAGSGGFNPLLPGPLHATHASSAALMADKQSVALMAVVKNYTPRCSQIRVALVAVEVVGTPRLPECCRSARRSRILSR